MIKHLPNLIDYSKEEILDIINLAIDMKKNPDNYKKKLKNKTLVMWFEKPSLRTRVSFETGMEQLGGHAIYLDTQKTHGDKGAVKDEVKCLSRFSDIIMARVFSHDTILEMIKSSDVPIINGLCDKFHPCQALADLMTVFEQIGENATIAYVGDGNNVCNSLIIICKKLGMKINVSTPSDLKPDYEADLWSEDPKEAVKDADVVYTDTWVSMGNEENKAEFNAKLKPYQVNSGLIGSKYFMHCLPAVRGNEVTNEVIDSDKSIIYDQAENRMHVQKAVILKLLNVE